jgi:signal transduction histidine kinase
MKWQSLRFRLATGGIVAILAALSVAGVGLVFLFERHVARTIAEDLDVYATQLLAAIDLNTGGQLVLAREPADPRFSNPLSGLYWQIGDDHGQLLRSRSLWDTVLTLPADDPPPGTVHHHTANGPLGARLLIAERRIMLTAAGQVRPVRVAVAADLSRVEAAAGAYTRDLAAALAILGLVLAIATTIQVGLGLRPLASLRRSVAEIRSGRSRHLPTAVPTEVQPLVAEVNALLDSQEKDMERARRRAADLAHGLKTPLAALATDADELRTRGEHAIAHSIEAVAAAMSRHVDRELARVRVKSAAYPGAAPATELLPVVRLLVATLSRAHADSSLQFAIEIADGAVLPLDRTDLTEVLGNLLENAARHARRWVRVSAVPGPSGSVVVVEDDGEGIAASAREAVLQTGKRLDERAGGAGLGLAIVQDVLEAYGWRLDLASSDLGGLKAIVAPDAAERAVA